MVQEIVDNAQPAGPRLKVTTLSDVEPEEVNWLWPKRIPRGKNTLLAGDPGQGKSYLSLDIAARVSVGGKWPDGGDVEQGNVLIVTAEDGIADTVRPRLDKLGADASRIHDIDLTVTTVGGSESLSLDRHIRLLEDEITRRDAVLLIIDPVTALVGRSDTYKASDVRQLLTPVVSMAERTGCAVLTIQHLNKRSSEHNALYRVSSSTDFVAVARSGFLVAPHPGDDALRVFCPIKSNLSAPADVLGFRVTDGSFSWEPDPLDIKVSELLNNPPSAEQRSELEDAKEFLSEVLADGPVAVKQVRVEAENVGISKSTLERAKNSLGVKSERVSDSNEGRGHWEWSLSARPPRVNDEHLADIGSSYSPRTAPYSGSRKMTNNAMQDGVQGILIDT
jgi:putative DNA primase/helicase